MSETIAEKSLVQDGDVHTPLERVNYAPGMLLGLDATQSEQAYHRRRLNRHRYWINGTGTLLGLAVSMQAEEVVDTDDDHNVDLIVSPGIGIDGLGREVMSHEPYCINLGEWINSRIEIDEAHLLQDGLIDNGETLSLIITMRYRDCESGLQPVMARKVNAGTNPVEASRTKDCILLEVLAAPTPIANKAEHIWPGHTHLQQEEQALTQAEQDYLASLSGNEKKMAAIDAELIYALPAHNRALEIENELDDVARTLLAHITIPLRTEQLPTISPIINPNRITINNLLRPSLKTADKLAWLALLQE